MKLQLNLSTTPLENKRPFAAAATVLGAVGLLTFLSLAHAAYTSWPRQSGSCVPKFRIGSPKFALNRQRQAELDAYFQTPQSPRSAGSSGVFEFVDWPAQFPLDQNLYGPGTNLAARGARGEDFAEAGSTAGRSST